MGSYTASTSLATPAVIKKKWLLIDAKGQCLGRLASRIAMLLRGKNKPIYTPYMNCGDNVIVINAKYVKVTGKKLEQNVFYWHTNYPGGIKERKWADILDGKYPNRLLEKAVERMMPKESPLAKKQMKQLYIYDEDAHIHAAQNPELISVAKVKVKNSVK